MRISSLAEACPETSLRALHVLRPAILILRVSAALQRETLPNRSGVFAVTIEFE